MSRQKNEAMRGVGLVESGMRALSDESEFERELAIFQVEHETAQQYFFSYASLRGIAASNSDVLRSMNATPLFWLTVESAMLLSAFIALGRIFASELAPQSYSFDEDRNCGRCYLYTGGFGGTEASGGSFG